MRACSYNDAPPVCRESPGWVCPEYVESWWPNKTKDGAIVFPYSQVLVYQAQARTNHSVDAGTLLPLLLLQFFLFFTIIASQCHICP
jgi:hypothetical protein